MSVGSTWPVSTRQEPTAIIIASILASTSVSPPSSARKSTPQKWSNSVHERTGLLLLLTNGKQRRPILVSTHNCECVGVRVLFINYSIDFRRMSPVVTRVSHSVSQCLTVSKKYSLCKPPT